MQHSTGKSSPSPHQWGEWWPLKRYVHGLVPEKEVAQSCPTLCDPMDCSLPGSSIHGIFQARVLEWVAISFENYLIWRKGLCTCSWGKDLEIKRHPRLFWKTLNPVTSILVRHMREKRRQTQKRKQQEEWGRDWSDAATSQGSWEIRQHQELGEAGKPSAPAPPEGVRPSHTLSVDSGLPCCERLDSCPFKPPFSRWLMQQPSMSVETDKAGSTTGEVRQPTGQPRHGFQAKGRWSCWGCPAVLGVPCWTKTVQDCHLCVTPSSGCSLPSKRQAPASVSGLSLTIPCRACTEVLQQGHEHWCPVIKHRFLAKSFITIIFKSTNNKCWRGCREKEPSYTVGGNLNWYSHYGEQYGGFLKKQKCSFHMI